jgi:hypothetical protein
VKRQIISLAVFLGLLAMASGAALASSSTTQTVGYSVSAINEIGVSGDPGALNITSTAAGSDPASVTDATTTYSISTNQSTRKITAVLNSAVASGLTLQVGLADPDGAGAATSAGTVTLTATAADVVTAISTLAASSKTITYTFSATMATGTVSSTSKVVTLTVTAG